LYTNTKTKVEKNQQGEVMKSALSAIVLVLALFFSISANAQGIPPYYSQNDFLMAPSSVYRDGLLGFSNPANLAFLRGGEGRFYWSTDGTNAGSFNNWGLFTGLGGLGFGMLHQETDNFKSTDYRISLSGGDDRISCGMAYGWSTSNIDTFKNESLFKTGLIFRPVRFVSLGLTGDFSFKTSARQGITEIGIRPLGTSLLTLFADMAMQKDTRFNDAPWSAGAAVEIVPGVSLTGRYFENEAFSAGLTIDFGRAHLASQIHFNDEQKHSYNTYSVRSGGRRSSVFPSLFFKEKKYLKLNLKGRVDYLNYRYFDKNTNRFLETLRNINAAADDPRVNAIALNLSSMKIAPEHAWEIREELEKARHKGKTVVIFIDDVGMTGYHLASVADKIVLDPEGWIMLYGYAMGRTYLKGTLEKLGLGFDEWRFFKYKSAVEVYSRDSMSDGDDAKRCLSIAFNDFSQVRFVD
jgi:protease-4